MWSFLVGPSDEVSDIFNDSRRHTHLLSPHRQPALCITCRGHCPFDILIRQHAASLNARVDARRLSTFAHQYSIKHQDLPKNHFLSFQRAVSLLSVPLIRIKRRSQISNIDWDLDDDEGMIPSLCGQNKHWKDPIRQYGGELVTHFVY